MSRMCSICSHVKRGEIDAALLAGEVSIRRIATQYGTTDSALRRHKAHLPASLARAQDAAAVARGDDLLSQVQHLQARALAILAKAERAGDLRTALQAIRETRSSVELLARLVGELQERSTTVNVAVAQAPEWITLRSAILEALTPYQDAKQAVIRAITE